MSQKRKCTKCNEEFLIIDQEEAFYKDKDFPLPEMCPKHRRERRVSDRHERELYGYTCDNCGKNIVVAFNPPDDWTIYCKKCYQDYYNVNDCILGYSDGAKSDQPGLKDGGQTGGQNNIPKTEPSIEDQKGAPVE